MYGSVDTAITSGSVGRVVQFTFDSRWESLTKTAVFTCGDMSKDVYLGSSVECELPWEILTEENVGQTIVVGVCGLREAEIVYPTIYTNIGKLVKGAKIVDDPSVEHTPELVEQLIVVASRAEEVAVHPPIIGENNNWWCWDPDKRVYIDTGCRAEGGGGAVDEEEVREIIDEYFEENPPEGEKEVYVGSGEMPEGYTIQIDPDGDEVYPSVVYTPQALSEEQKSQARQNIGATSQDDVRHVVAISAVLHSEYQQLSDGQKRIARANIGAASVEDVLNALPTWEGGSY